jgi:hypothetical protein
VSFRREGCSGTFLEGTLRYPVSPRRRRKSSAHKGKGASEAGMLPVSSLKRQHLCTVCFHCCNKDHKLSGLNNPSFSYISESKKSKTDLTRLMSGAMMLSRSPKTEPIFLLFYTPEVAHLFAYGPLPCPRPAMAGQIFLMLHLSGLTLMITWSSPR